MPRFLGRQRGARNRATVSHTSMRIPVRRQGFQREFDADDVRALQLRRGLSFLGNRIDHDFGSRNRTVVSATQ